MRLVARPGVIADLGCGDGLTLRALQRAGLLGPETFAVDLSPERLANVAAALPDVVPILADATRVDRLPDASVDGVIASQVIEHLPDDRALAPEIARLLRPGGWWYVGSVLRGRRAWWIYRVDGERRLDPTHVREYRAEGELRAALEHPRLELTSLAVSQLRFPVADLALRAAARLGLVAYDRLATTYERSRALARARRLQFPVVGYELIEAAGTRSDG